MIYHKQIPACLDNVQRARTDVPFDQFLTGPHFLKQRRVTNNPRRVLDFAARFVEPRNDSDYRAFHDVGQVGDAIEAHPSGPFVHYLDHAEAGLANEIVGIIGGQDHLVECLDLIDLLGYLDDCGNAAFQAGGQSGFYVSLFLEDKGREKSDDLFRGVVCEHVLEDKLCQNQLVGRVDLRLCQSKA